VSPQIGCKARNCQAEQCKPPSGAPRVDLPETQRCDVAGRGGGVEHSVDQTNAARWTATNLRPVGQSGNRCSRGSNQSHGDCSIRSAADNCASCLFLEHVEDCSCSPGTERHICQYHVQWMSQPGPMQNIRDLGSDGTVGA